MALLTQDSFAIPLKYEDVEIKELKGSVRVTELSAAAYSTYQNSLVDIDKDGKVTQTLKGVATMLVALAVVGEDGNPIMDVKQWGKEPQRIVEKLYAVASRLNGDNSEEVEKNSEGGQED